MSHRVPFSSLNWVAQEKIARSAVPVWSADGITCGHAAILAFLVEDEDKWHLMPGGLIRIAPDTGPMQLSVAGGDGSKDLWIIADGKVEPHTLLQLHDKPTELRRTSALFPSRVADNLFWLGRSLDCCDFLARLIRTHGTGSTSRRRNSKRPRKKNGVISRMS